MTLPRIVFTGSNHYFGHKAANFNIFLHTRVNIIPSNFSRFGGFHHVKPLHKLLNTGKALASVGEKLAAQDALLKQLRSLLPQPMDQHCVWTVLKKGDLILLVDSPAWASRLRYLSPKLTQQLRQSGLSVRRILVKVTLINTRHIQRKKSRRAIPMSSSNAKLLSSVAETVDDAELRDALMRLSKCGLD